MLDLFSFQFNLNTADNNNANANTNNNNGNVVNVMPPGKKKRQRRYTKTDNQKTMENRSTNETESLENKCSPKNESHLAQASLASVVLLQVRNQPYKYNTLNVSYSTVTCKVILN